MNQCQVTRPTFRISRDPNFRHPHHVANQLHPTKSFAGDFIPPEVVSLGVRGHMNVKQEMGESPLEEAAIP